MPTYDYSCKECGAEATYFKSYEERDKGPACLLCPESKSMVRVYKKMPGITRASYIDSANTGRARSVYELKEIAKLEIKNAEAVMPDEKAGLQKEIKQRRKVKK